MIIGPRIVVVDSAERDRETVEVLHYGPIYGGMDPAKRRAMVDTLIAQRQLWQRNRPRAYVIRTFEVSTCIEVRTRPRVGGQALREQLTVQDTTIVRRQNVPIPAIYNQRWSLAWRVDDLFADLTRALADKEVAVMDLQYDPAYGFPRRYTVIRGGSSDDGHAVLVESFASAP